MSENNDKVSYLQMIQGNIERMSTASAIFKGFAATIIAGLSGFSFKETNTTILILAFIPVVSFLLLDAYYLNLERKYRYLYEQVRTDKKDVDFNLKLWTMSKCEKCKSKTRIVDILKSPSIWLFYPILIIVGITIIGMRFGGII